MHPVTEGGRRFFLITLLTAILAASATAVAQESAGEPTLSVAEAALATGVENLAPQGVAEQFAATVGQVYAFTRITGAQGETSVKHLWYRNDQLVAEVELPVRSPNWRTYSSKRITPTMTGGWRVDITDVQGNLLKSLPFRVE